MGRQCLERAQQSFLATPLFPAIAAIVWANFPQGVIALFFPIRCNTSSAASRKSRISPHQLTLAGNPQGQGLAASEKSFRHAAGFCGLHPAEGFRGRNLSGAAQVQFDQA